MKMRAADYIAQLLLEHGIEQVFAVVGGGAMHLDDAFGNTTGLSCMFNHHEQACAIAAEGYARVDGRLAVACVTSGPGGTNTMTGILCAWNDSIPLLVISGQVRTDTTIESTGMKLRQFGEQEYDIVNSVSNMTKYAVMITDGQDIRYCLEKAIYEATHGRRGPCWVDVPLDIQAMEIDTETQRSYIPPESCAEQGAEVLEKSKDELLLQLVEKVSCAKRPVILAGSAIRTSGCYEEFRAFVQRTKLPVVAATGISDLFPVGAKGYYGNFGVIGGRCGNFMVQNADCLLVLGARLSLKQIGFNYENFSQSSYKIMVDVDPLELKKETITIDLPVCMDLKMFFAAEPVREMKSWMDEDGCWRRYCDELKNRYTIYQETYENSKCVNPYYMAKTVQRELNDDGIVVVGNSCASDMTRQMGILKEGQRMWGNTNCGTMGYDLPAAIGAAVSSRRQVVCVTGDGSVMMNLQELQTIKHNKLPIKILIHNNGGYEAIVNTHTGFFGRLTGCTKDSGISFPDFAYLAKAFDIPYIRCADHRETDEKIPQFLQEPGPGICEIISDETQMITPKTKSRQLEDGKMYSPPIDDLFPFLEREEYELYSDFKRYQAEIREGQA